MRCFRDTSINTKLNLLVLVTGGVAVLLLSSAFVIDNVVLIRSTKVSHLSAIARILGSNSTAALTFDDAAAASELLGSLSLQPTVRYACLYNHEGKIFTEYHCNAAAAMTPPPLGGEGYEFCGGSYLDITQPIRRDGELVGTVYLRASMDDLKEQLLYSLTIVVGGVIVSLGIAFGLSFTLQRSVAGPIVRLAQTTQRISADRDYSLRVKKVANDELGVLYDEFNGMLDQIQRGERELHDAHDHLEMRVQDRTRQLSKANEELARQMAERERAEQELQQVHGQLVEAARRAGMAEIATGVLHNVGNVLNSVNVSATLVTDRVRNSRLLDLTRALNLMDEHADDLGRFLTQHEKGKRVPEFLKIVATHLGRESSFVLQELQSLVRNIDHIKTIVAMQQSYTGVAGVVEPVSLADLLDDALKMNAPSLAKYSIEVVREYADLPEVEIEKQKLLQILVNLVANAKDSLRESDQPRRRLTARIGLSTRGGTDRVFIEIGDNGLGIPAENLTQIFSHGFTTKKHGHGFGLHSSANTAKELNGSLRACSEGLGQGAAFTVELPFIPSEVLV